MSPPPNLSSERGKERGFIEKGEGVILEIEGLMKGLYILQALLKIYATQGRIVGIETKTCMVPHRGHPLQRQ